MNKILIVDDQAEIRELLHETLDLSQSFEIMEAVDGLGAVELADTMRPDLVLLDIMMPGPIDGVEACRCIKAIRADGTPKVILVSAKLEHDLRQAAVEAGADLYLCKPFSPLQLVDHISALYMPKEATSP